VLTESGITAQAAKRAMTPTAVPSGRNSNPGNSRQPT